MVQVAVKVETGSSFGATKLHTEWDAMLPSSMSTTQPGLCTKYFITTLTESCDPHDQSRGLGGQRFMVGYKFYTCSGRLLSMLAMGLL